MKLTDEQLLLLKDTIRERVTYRETYEEVYDHILTALEHSNDDVSLATTIHSIVLSDFGGFTALRLMERRRKWVVVHQMLIKQWEGILTFLWFPLLPITCIIYYLLYYSVSKLDFHFYGMLIFSAAVFIGLIFRCVRYFRRKIIYKNTQKSVNDYPFHIIS